MNCAHSTDLPSAGLEEVSLWTKQVSGFPPLNLISDVPVPSMLKPKF